MSSDFDVRYTAQLARLSLSDAEAQRFQQQLSQVLGYVEKLKEVDVSDIEPMAHTSNLLNVFRPDEPREWFQASDALANAPQPSNGLFLVPKVLE